MNAPFRLTGRDVPTVEKPAFKTAMDLAKRMQAPTRGQVKAWAAAMKLALGGSLS